MPSNIYELLLQYIALFCVEANQQLHYCNVTPSFILGTCDNYVVTNGIVVYIPPAQENEHRVGATGMTTCNPGFTLMGDTNRTCEDDGEWSGSTTCECSTTNHAFSLGVWLRISKWV